MSETQWLTTAPNPRSPTTGYDAGQRGWVLHAVLANPVQTFESIKRERSACGLIPTHGWGLDLFITRRCSRCAAAIAKARGKSSDALDAAADARRDR